ncbi:MraZ protein [Nakamurella sp. UYEF19]|uniref:division/cell wall cluster transcriptional repressor MraZ n=1 Tax=Nakamurella sp. UYEF19 TaxID=1756392 RepID=UPI003392D71F
MFTGFLGTYTPRMDDKGRVTLPARYRETFAPGVMIVRGQDHCLYLFTPDGFDDFAEVAINAPITNAEARGYQRYMLSNTDDQRPDAQGRISIPIRMREYAGLTKDVIIAGVGKRMEVWDADEWARYEASQEAGYASPPSGVLNQPGTASS